MVDYIKNNSSSKFKILLGFLTIYFVWGSTYLGIRFAIDSFPPFVMGGFRFIIAGSILLIWNYIKSPVKPSLLDWKVGAITGLFMFGVGNGAVNWAEQFIPSSLAALVIATMPIWMILIHWLQTKEDKPDILTIIGIVVGIVGVSLLSGIDDSVLINANEFGGSLIIGLLVLVCGTIFWSLGSLKMRRHKSKISIVYLAGIQTFVGGIALATVSMFNGEFSTFKFANVTTESLFAICYLIVFGTFIAFLTFTWLMQVSSPGKVSTYAYFNPIVAIVLGSLLAGEIITIEMIGGTVLILSAIMLINKPWKLFGKKNNSKKITKSAA